MIDPLLRKFESASLSLMINDLFVGGFAHTNDIRTITNSLTSLNAQLELVSALRLIISCYLIFPNVRCVFPKAEGSAQPQVSLDGAILPCNNGVKCLNYV